MKYGVLVRTSIQAVRGFFLLCMRWILWLDPGKWNRDYHRDVVSILYTFNAMDM